MAAVLIGEQLLIALAYLFDHLVVTFAHLLLVAGEVGCSVALLAFQLLVEYGRLGGVTLRGL